MRETLNICSNLQEPTHPSQRGEETCLLAGKVGQWARGVSSEKPALYPTYNPPYKEMTWDMPVSQAVEIYLLYCQYIRMTT